MAEKGDFNECEKCTSFQCTTCGLEASRGEGYVTERKTAFKSCIYFALGIIAFYVFKLAPISLSTTLFLLIFPLAGMYVVTQPQISVIVVYMLLIFMVGIGFWILLPR